MEDVLMFWAWLKENYVNVLISVAALVGFLETVVRLTPTKKDDGAVARLGKAIDWILDLLKIPNVNKIQTFKEDPKKDAEKPS